MNGELSFEVNKDQCEALREILKQQGIRHFKLETTDFGEFDVVEYKEYQKLEQKVNRLSKKYNKALEILNEYGMPCERDNFNLLDTDYCEINCSNDEEQFKKCWDEFIKWRLDKDE